MPMELRGFDLHEELKDKILVTCKAHNGTLALVFANTHNLKYTVYCSTYLFYFILYIYIFIFCYAGEERRANFFLKVVQYFLANGSFLAWIDRKYLGQLECLKYDNFTKTSRLNTVFSFGGPEVSNVLALVDCSQFKNFPIWKVHKDVTSPADYSMYFPDLFHNVLGEKNEKKKYVL